MQSGTPLLWEGGVNLAGLFGPAIQAARPEKFSGYDEDWPQWERQWTRYAGLVQAQYPAIHDWVWLTIVLQPLLDPASSLRLDSLLQRNPDTPYLEFWRELERTFGRDMTERHRQEWESIAMDPHADLTLRGFRQHMGQWELALSRVSGVSAEEAARRFLRSLPVDYHEWARHEELRRTQGQFWVRMSKNGLSLMEVTGWLQGFLGFPPAIEDGGAHFLVDCGSEEQREIVLSLNGVDVRGQPLVISLYRRPTAYQEVAKWIEEKLRIREEIFPTPRTPTTQYKGKTSNQAHVHEVIATPTSTNQPKPSPPRTSSPKPKPEATSEDTREDRDQSNNRNRGRSPWRGKGGKGRGDKPRDSSNQSARSGKGGDRSNSDYAYNNNYNSNYNSYYSSGNNYDYNNRGGRGKGSGKGEEPRPTPPLGSPPQIATTTTRVPQGSPALGQGRCAEDVWPTKDRPTTIGKNASSTKAS